MTNGRPKRLVDVTLHFDGEIRETARGVELIRFDDRASRTRLETSSARLALIERGSVRFEIEIRHDLTEEQPCAGLWIDDAGVLADPAKPCRLREPAFLDWSGVDARKRFESWTVP